MVETLQIIMVDGDTEVIYDELGKYTREMISGVKTPPPFSETLDLYVCRGDVCGYRWWGDNGTMSPFFHDNGDAANRALDHAFEWLETL